MIQAVSHILRLDFWFGGRKKSTAAPKQTRDYSSSEIAFLRRQLKENNAAAAKAVDAAGVTLHPKIAAARAERERVKAAS